MATRILVQTALALSCASLFLAPLAHGGECDPACPTDLSGDGITDGADLGILLAGWGGPGCPDINLDGIADGADLGALLAAWGPCPPAALCPPSDHGCYSTGGPGCTDAACCESTCAADGFCCEVAWDGICVAEAISVCGLPACAIVCAGSGENEPCGSDLNGGCNMDNPSFTPIACGESICGTTWADGGVRDTDWFQISFADETQVTFHLSSSMPMVVGLVDTGGLPECAVASMLEPAAFSEFCGDAHVSACLAPGTYWLFAAPSSFAGFPCGSGANDYFVHLLCNPPNDIGAAIAGVDNALLLDEGIAVALAPIDPALHSAAAATEMAEPAIVALGGSLIQASALAAQCGPCADGAVQLLADALALVAGGGGGDADAPEDDTLEAQYARMKKAIVDNETRKARIDANKATIKDLQDSIKLQEASGQKTRAKEKKEQVETLKKENKEHKAEMKKNNKKIQEDLNRAAAKTNNLSVSVQQAQAMLASCGPCAGPALAALAPAAPLVGQIAQATAMLAPAIQNVDASLDEASYPMEITLALTEQGLAILGGCPGCGSLGAESCFVAQPTPFCDDAACCQLVCDLNGFCCQVAWDALCADQAVGLCAPN